MKRRKSKADNSLLFPGKREEDKKFDPQGSYTGVPLEPDEKPVQDVDDL